MALKSILLGIVEGVTEFLPISSTGHMIIFENLIGFTSQTPSYVDMYTYVIQLGAILAVVVLYRRKIADTLVHFFPKKVGFEKSGLRFWLMIVIACIPGFFCQILLDDIAETYLFNPTSVAITLFAGGILMIVAENYLRKRRHSLDENWSVNAKQALIIGLFQCLAIIPGMSRSASTIIGGWVVGLSSVAAAEFWFFLAIPVMIGMSALKIIKIGGFADLTPDEIIALVVGFVTAFGVALVVVKRFIAFLKKKPMRIFAIYRMLFAVVVILAGVFGLFQSM